jgi:predicted DNA-binding transcriptional regulator AlpA
MKTQQSVIRIKPLYLAREEAAQFLSISTGMLDKLVAQGAAPKPRKLSAGRSAWLVEELEAWGKSCPVSDLLPPPNAGHHSRPDKPV